MSDDNELGIYDSLTGKYYKTLFDLEEAFYESNMYVPGSLPDPPVIEPLRLEPLQMAFTPTEMDMDVLMKSVTPTFTQRVDWVTIVGYNVVPNPIAAYSIAVDDLF